MATHIDTSIMGLAGQLISEDAKLFGDPGRVVATRIRVHQFVDNMVLEMASNGHGLTPEQGIMCRTLAEALVGALHVGNSHMMCARIIADLTRLAPHVGKPPQGEKPVIGLKKAFPTESIPKDVCYSARNNTFHDSLNDAQLPDEFFEKWYDRRDEFPPREHVV